LQTPLEDGSDRRVDEVQGKPQGEAQKKFFLFVFVATSPWAVEPVGR
jgi:hypothetical protein